MDLGKPDKGVSVQGEHGKARTLGPPEISIRGVYKVAVYKDCREDTRGRQEVCGCRHARGAGISGCRETGVWGQGIGVLQHEGWTNVSALLPLCPAALPCLLTMAS